MTIWIVETAWGTFSCPVHSMRLYSKKVRRGALGWFSQLGDSANPALVMWPRADSIWIPLFAVKSIRRETIPAASRPAADTGAPDA